ncbi:metabotropic gaba-b receptor subtype 2 isoform c [Anaeramoeba flamelloides]|uniref:Metabotropic gaba-b receptor subtype 2 isoform c n=1 Tax=Anaeramoeba flamelloides TaxID=1746091 RepID=A0AAV7Z6S7_9EUKA|nr:metabotropic gaba-b receptor subtype 2 isoform c [Anaeramoeba flamelloides]
MFSILLESSYENERGLWCDVLVTVLVCIMCFVTLVGVSIFYYFRKYPGIKAKQPEIILVSILAGILISISSIQANNHFFKEKGTFWAVCDLWKAWLQLNLGGSVWINCLLLRSYRLYRVFIKRKKTTVKFFWISLGILQTPWIILGIITSAVGGVEYDDDGGKCSFRTIFLVLYVILCVINMTLLFITIYQTRKIVEEYSGYKELRLGLLVSLVAVIISAILWAIKEAINSSQDNKLGSIIWRCFYTLTLASVVTYFFFKSSVYVTIKAFHNDQEYIQKLRKAITEFSYNRADEKIAQAKKKKETETENINDESDVELENNESDDTSSSSDTD